MSDASDDGTSGESTDAATGDGASESVDGDADAPSDEELQRIKEQKKEQLQSGPTPNEPVHVESGDQFEDLVTGDGVVMVDFYADWCGPCQTLEPIVGAVAETMPATVAKVDVDEHQQIARDHGVQGVPTLLFFADGELVERRVGFQDEMELGRIIDQYA